MKKKKIVNRAEAIKNGSSVYYTGMPCKKGHVVQRYTTNGACLECIRLARVSEKEAIKVGRMQVSAHG